MIQRDVIRLKRYEVCILLFNTLNPLGSFAFAISIIQIVGTWSPAYKAKHLSTSRLESSKTRPSEPHTSRLQQSIIHPDSYE